MKVKLPAEKEFILVRMQPNKKLETPGTTYGVGVISAGENFLIVIEEGEDSAPDFKLLKDFLRDLRSEVTKLEREYWENQI